MSSTALVFGHMAAAAIEAPAWQHHSEEAAPGPPCASAQLSCRTSDKHLTLRCGASRAEKRKAMTRHKKRKLVLD